jgi:hypothetical protein
MLKMHSFRSHWLAVLAASSSKRKVGKPLDWRDGLELGAP